jgi:hypothetical protein
MANKVELDNNKVKVLQAMAIMEEMIANETTENKYRLRA